MHKRAMVVLLIAASLPLRAQVAPPTVLPPFNTDYRFEAVGNFAGGPNALGPFGGGMAFDPRDPSGNTLLVGDDVNDVIRLVSIQRNGANRIVGLQAAGPVIPAPGIAYGLAVGPRNTLIYTTDNDELAQLVPPYTASPVITGPVPTALGGLVCAFVPSGHNGAGRFKVLEYSDAVLYDVGLVAAGPGTFSLGTVTPIAALSQSGSSQCLTYPPASSPQLGNHVLMGRWTSSGSVGARIVAYPLDANGDPIVGLAQDLACRLGRLSGSAADPVTGELLFLGESNGTWEGWALRRQSTPCGTVTRYGQPSPGSGAVPTIAATGCPRIGASVTLLGTSDPLGLGVLAIGTSAANRRLGNIVVLQNLVDLITIATDANGQWSVPLNIPPQCGLAFGPVYFQTGFVDPSTSSGFKASDGIAMFVR